MSSLEELVGEVGTIKGVVFVDENGMLYPLHDPLQCPECGFPPAAMLWHQVHADGSTAIRWRCPEDHTWVTWITV